MKLIYRGKTKDVYKRKDGKLELHFKDTATGEIIGKRKIIFDPGQDSVVGRIAGKGKISCALSSYFFRLLTKKGIPNHYLETPRPGVMVVEPANLLNYPGLYNLEFVYRNNAYGSFLKRYPFVSPCQPLSGLIEITTKGKTDHLITDESLVKLRILTEKELNCAKRLTKVVGQILTKEFSKRNLHLIDLKIELGKVRGELAIIDEISPDCLRVCQKTKIDTKGNCLAPCQGKNLLTPNITCLTQKTIDLVWAMRIINSDRMKKNHRGELTPLPRSKSDQTKNTFKIFSTKKS